MLFGKYRKCSTKDGESSTKDGESSTKDGKCSTKDGKCSTNIREISEIDTKKLLSITRVRVGWISNPEKKLWDPLMVAIDDEKKGASPPMNMKHGSMCHSLRSDSGTDHGLNERDDFNKLDHLHRLYNFLTKLDSYIMCVFADISRVVKTSFIDEQVKKAYSQAADAFSQALIQEVEELKATNKKLLQQKEIGDEYTRARTRLFYQTCNLQQYVKAIFPPLRLLQQH